MTDLSSSRREFFEAFGGRGNDADQANVSQAGALLDTVHTVRIATKAMACEFCAILNSKEHLEAASDTLELIHEIESWLSIYRNTSLISQVNQAASRQPVPVHRQFLDVLTESRRLHEVTEGAYDITSGALIQVWKRCRGEKRVPADEEIQSVLACCGIQHLTVNEQTSTVGFGVEGMQLDPGAIGKGYALDRAAEWLSSRPDAPESFLLHGGHSSLIGRGSPVGAEAWPVGVGNPLLTQKRLGQVMLRDRAMSTSGSNIQFFRHEGQRYGHILDPRTGWPVNGMLSVTVLADSAAVADALSTAFFVLGVEKALKCCDNLDNVGAVLIPFPEKGKRVTPVVTGIPEKQIIWDEEQVAIG